MGKYLMAEEFTNGTDGELQFLQEGKVIPVYGASKCKTSSTPKVTKRGQIGTRNKQAKMSSFENKLTITADYYLVAIIRGWLITMRRTGKWPKIDLMMVNRDDGTSMGQMSTLYKDLVPDGEIPLQELDEAAETGLTIELTFTFRDWDSLDEFADPTGIGTE